MTPVRYCENCRPILVQMDVAQNGEHRYYECRKCGMTAPLYEAAFHQDTPEVDPA